MNKEIFKNFAVGAVCILLAGMVLLAVESRGQIVESRFGIVGLVILLGLIVIAAILTKSIENEIPKDEPISPSKTAKEKNKKT